LEKLRRARKVLVEAERDNTKSINSHISAFENSSFRIIVNLHQYSAVMQVVFSEPQIISFRPSF
jgi:septation ring formation regulator EzrA